MRTLLPLSAIAIAALAIAAPAQAGSPGTPTVVQQRTPAVLITRTRHGSSGGRYEEQTTVRYFDSRSAPDLTDTRHSFSRVNLDCTYTRDAQECD
jgi:hypothetical protein